MGHVVMIIQIKNGFLSKHNHLEVDRRSILGSLPQDPPSLLLRLSLTRLIPGPQPPLLLDLMPNDLRPLHRPPAIRPRQL